MSGHLARITAASLLLSACAVDGSDADSIGPDGQDCVGGKCDDLGDDATSGVIVFNPCRANLTVGLAAGDAEEPSGKGTITPGGARFFPADRGDHIVITDLGGSGWRTVAYVEQGGPLDIDPGYCPWDVFIESGVVTEKAADGRDWDTNAVGGFTRPDPYATGFGDGEADNCKGYPTVQGTPTSTDDDTTTPHWNQETLSWIAWHDMSSSVDLVVTDDDVGLGGEPIGTCKFENIPTPDQLPAVITSDCGGGGSMTIRIEPADNDPVDTVNVPVGGTCG